jgi:signal transduction histidine kinase
MSDPTAGPPRVRPRQSLSARLWLLTTLAVLLSEVVVFPPFLAHERTVWLAGRVEDASFAMLAARGDGVNATQHDQLLRLAGVEGIRVGNSDGSAMSIGDVAATPDAELDTRQESLLSRIHRSLHSLLLDQNRLLRVTTNDPHHAGAVIELTMREAGLSRTLREFAGDFAGLALAIAAVAGGLVYLAVLLLLVRPMRRITGSIAAFRADPEHTRPLDPDEVTVLANDEIAVASQELAAMQHELRAALWRNARLAALGTVVAKVSHDLRGILTPALLTAERLQLNADPRVQRAGETLALAVDRATDLVRRTLDYAREGPPPLDFVPLSPAALMNEAAEGARLGNQPQLQNTIDAAIMVRADRIQLFRVFLNLLRNAAEAGARVVTVSAQHDGSTLTIDIADNGPGLPELARAHLFRPFAGSLRRGGSGLGLAIARDLMVAHGGDIALVSTDVTGTVFRLVLRLADPPQVADDSENVARIAPATAADV